MNTSTGLYRKASVCPALPPNAPTHHGLFTEHEDARSAKRWLSLHKLPQAADAPAEQEDYKRRRKKKVQHAAERIRLDKRQGCRAEVKGKEKDPGTNGGNIVEQSLAPRVINGLRMK